MSKSRFILAACLPALLIACGSNPEGDKNAADAGAETEAVALKAPSGTYVLDNTHATLGWSIPHMGLADYTARFASFDATVTLDTENLEKSTVTLMIDPASVRTDYPNDWKASRPDSPYKSWDDEIASDEAKLAAADGKPITFTSTSVSQTGPRTADVTGDLTFRGQTKPVTMQASFNGDIESHPFAKVPAIGFNATGSFKPSDFGVNLLGGVLGDEVKINFSGEFRNQPVEAAAAGETAAAAE